MYKIFLHVSCITILEICFFFYYIGPLETDIFYSYIRRIIDGPLEQLDDTLAEWHISRKQFIELLYSETADNDFEDNLEIEKDEGKKKREKDNEELFATTIEYWTLILGLAFFLFLCEYIYYYYDLRRSKNIIPTEDEFIENEMIPANSYRKHSIDEEELGLKLKEINRRKCIWVCLKTGGHYIIFGCSIITFQYLFFQYVVFEYKPLSIDEIKYFVYQYLLENR